jgi:hypothetical protein
MRHKEIPVVTPGTGKSRSITNGTQKVMQGADKFMKIFSYRNRKPRRK